ncbi:MAG: threonine aldolase family protein, partial [Geodermatophilaceae bacterium]
MTDVRPQQADDALPSTEALVARFREAQRAATRWVPGTLPVGPAARLRELADEVESGGDDTWDRYGERGPLAEVEHQVAELLGKPAAAMFPSGVMAQQSMLRVWSDLKGSRRVALPAQSHLLHHEQDGPRLVHGFRYEIVSDGLKVPTVDDLAKIPGPLGACLVELPLRDAGYLLPTWDELSAFARACRERDVPLHFDGARIWESTPYLDHTLAEVADLADSVYVSFYKGLGGLAGAVVAGPVDQVDEARQWRQRLGGTLVTMLPFAVSALRGLRAELPRMAEYHERAVELATALTGAGLTVFPDPPHANAFRLHIEQSHTTLMERLCEFMERERIAVSPPWQPADVPGWSWTEFTVGPATLEWLVDEAVEL